ncbi:PspC domain-containing protein [Gaetbulibacter saemankumensis]|uniref:PspC domain-containing protein n=1 Tax=Gaetbulibacter saemankumensis TaxID=311208 RepID=UPI00040687B1|nr:PspC domain-containing protein [Gaetbulibacter saemankumensis]
MNKTVNINLAGIFFHIDEDAYLKLQRYLEAIKRSFTDSQGRSEIISDIEARIAELFSERIKNDKQVIGLKEVDEVISIMGQPEDYLVDDEIFEDNPQANYKQPSAPSKKLFRDTDNSYISGVSSGLGHYLSVDTVWIRLLWIILTIASGGTFIIIYILFWILVPEAKTTAEKIMMTGDPVNISNIEKKIKDSIETVSETVTDVAKNVSESVSGAAKNVSDAAKKVDIQKQGNKIKSSSKSFFDTVADIIMFFFKIFAKLIGLFLLLLGAITLIALIIGLFSVGVVNFVHIPGIDLANIVMAGNSPVWLISLLVLFFIGIPFFFLFYLGLKILIDNLKSIGNVAKYTLLGLWLCSIIGLAIIGIREASEHANNEHFVERTQLTIKSNDTLYVKMNHNDIYKNPYRRRYSFKAANNSAGEKTIYSSNINILVRPTLDSVASINIEKSADGRNYEKAIERAEHINYSYHIESNVLALDSYLSTAVINKYSDQKVEIYLNIPENTILKFHNNTKNFLQYYTNNDHVVSTKHVNHFITMTTHGVLCDFCVDEEKSFEVKVDSPSIKINDSTVEINSDGGHVKINKEGLKAESKEIKVEINADGVKIESDN